MTIHGLRLLRLLMLLLCATPRLPVAPGSRSDCGSFTGTAGQVGMPHQEPGGSRARLGGIQAGVILAGGIRRSYPLAWRGPRLAGEGHVVVDLFVCWWRVAWCGYVCN